MALQPSATVRNTADGEAAEASMVEVSEPSLQLDLRWRELDSNLRFRARYSMVSRLGPSWSGPILSAAA